MNRTRSAFSRAALTIAAIAFTPLLGCSGSSQDPPTASGPSDQAVCNAVKTYINACPDETPSSACTQALLAELASDCSSIVASYSTAFKVGVTTCAPASTCPNDDPYESACLRNAVGGAALTAAETKLANDYCDSCATSTGQTVAECTAAFYGVGDAAVPGPGAEYLQASDTILERIDSSCAASASTCATFSACAQNVATPLSPAIPAACTTSAPAPIGSR